MYFEKNEGLYKTENIFREIEKLNNGHNKTTLLNSANNFKEFYSRYKKRVHEFKIDIITVMKGE